MMPIQQFNNWYENNDHHNNEFYGLTSKNNVSMGVNQNGLTIIEEDSPLPANAKQNRRFQQPVNGTAEEMIKYGILQNFNTVDEILLLLNKIFTKVSNKELHSSLAKLFSESNQGFSN